MERDTIPTLSDPSALPEKVSSSIETQDATTLSRLGNAILLDRLKATLVQSRWLAAVDVPSEVSAFLDSRRTEATQRTYGKAIARFLAWCETRSLHPFLVSPRSADLYIADLVASPLKPASVASAVAGVSAWYSVLERRHPVKNPFRGTRALPVLGGSERLEYPDDNDVRLILLWCSPIDAAGVATMAYRGLRVGALPSLTIRGNWFEARSKGATVSGTLPASVLALIDAAGLDLRAPFRGSTAEQWSSRLAKKMARMAQAWIIHAPYSVHDFRHYYASREYLKDRDLNRLGRLLGHSSPGMTERYVHTQLGL